MFLSRLPRLVVLSLAHLTAVTDSAVFMLGANCKTLQVLELSFCANITTSGVYALIKQLPNLIHVSLCGVYAVLPALRPFSQPPPPHYNAAQSAVYCVLYNKDIFVVRKHLDGKVDRAFLVGLQDLARTAHAAARIYLSGAA